MQKSLEPNFHQVFWLQEMGSLMRQTNQKSWTLCFPPDGFFFFLLLVLCERRKKNSKERYSLVLSSLACKLLVAVVIGRKIVVVATEICLSKLRKSSSMYANT